MKLRPGSTMSTMFYINYNSFALFFFFSLSRCLLLLLLFSPLFKPDLRCSVIARSLIIINQLRLILCFLSDIPRALRLLVEEPQNDLKPHKPTECKTGNTANG